MRDDHLLSLVAPSEENAGWMPAPRGERVAYVADADGNPVALAAAA
jgi:hypothetical protein